MAKLKIILGRSGTGKSQWILERMQEQVQSLAKEKEYEFGKKKHIILTPDQYSHQLERRMCQVGGDVISLFCEVLTFSRMCNHIFHHCGGAEDPELDVAGRMILLYRSVSQARGHLKTLSAYSQHSGFFDKLMKTLDELKANCITTDQLFSIEDESQQQEKIEEIALIFGLYDCYTQSLSQDQREALGKALGITQEELPQISVQFDPRDRISRMASALGNSDWGEGKVFWVDGFSDFTPQQLEVLRHLLAQSEEMTVTLTGDIVEEWEEDSLFAPCYRSLIQLKKIAEDLNVAVEVEELPQVPSFPLRCPALQKVEQALFAEEMTPFQGELSDEITIFSADSPRSEVEWVASEILRLVQSGAYRFRDFVLVARDFSGYRPHIETVFPRFGIPVFATEMRNILEKPVLSVVQRVYQVLQNQYRYEDVMAYLKTGFASLTPQEVDRLEEYALFWDIHGDEWKKEWTKHPKRYDGIVDEAVKKKLKKLNLLREKALTPLMTLEMASISATGQAHCVALYTFLVEIKLPQKIYFRKKELLEQGDPHQSQEYDQLWEIVCRGLEQCHQLLVTKEQLSLDEFSTVFQLALSQYQVGAIPQSLDQVTAGETTRLKGNRCKVLVWLGCESTVVPKVTQSSGLFTDSDRVVLEGMGLSLNPQQETLLHREITTAYEILSLPREKLVVSWANMNHKGEQTSPSFLVERLEKLFPSLSVVQEKSLKGAFRLRAPESALQQILAFPFVAELLVETKWKQQVETLEKLQDLQRGSLSKLAVKLLYGETLTLSATGLQLLNSCQFAFFMQYGLKAKLREKAEFAAREYGTLVHHVLEMILEDRKGKSGKISEAERETLLEKLPQIMDDYQAQILGGKNQLSQREDYLYRRLYSGVKTIVVEALDELSVSKFAYLEGEVEFSLEVPTAEEQINLKLRGSVDRVDSYIQASEENNTEKNLYLRLIDYKTGQKNLVFHELFYGRDLQLLIYYYALKNIAQEKWGGNGAFSQVQAVALSYFPAKAVTVSADYQDDKAEQAKERQTELKRKGLYLEDEALIEALEPRSLDNTYRFLPLRYVKSRGGDKKNPGLTGSGLVWESQMEDLLAWVSVSLAVAAEKVSCGSILADPYLKDKNKSACTYCDFKSACHFVEGINEESYRDEPKLKKPEVLAQIHEVLRKNSLSTGQSASLPEESGEDG